jgi:ribosome-associated translation inhibitor RaiA
MNTPTRISFRNMDRSPALAERVEYEVEKLRRYAPALSHCDVMVEALHRHHRFGHHYQVHLTLRLPGSEVVVAHESPARRAVEASGAPQQPAKQSEVEADHRDAYVAVRDAFDVARRRMEDAIHRGRDRRRTRGAAPSPRDEEPAVPDTGNLASS